MMTPDELREFKRIYGTTTNRELAMKFRTSISHVKTLGKKHCLGKDKKMFPIEYMPRWTEEEKEIMRTLYPILSNEELVSKHLNRTVKSVMSKAHIMGITKTDDRLRNMGYENIKLRRDRIPQE